MSSRFRTHVMMNAKLGMLKEGIHYNAEGKEPVGEKSLFKDPSPEEQNVEQSKTELAAHPLNYATRRDAMIDYMNPREELSKFTKGVDEILPFDKGPISQLRPYDDIAKQQVNLVILGRSSFIGEESKYDVTLDNRRMKYLQEQMKKVGTHVMGPSPGPTPDMAAEIALASLMETTQSL